MKKTSLLILASALATSSITLAATVGSVPKCTSGVVNIEIYNKNLLSDDCYSLNSKGKYCMYDLYLEGNDHGENCVDDADTLVENLNESYSMADRSSTLLISHYLYTKGGAKKVDLKFYYDGSALKLNQNSKPSFTNNCAELFGPDVSCVTTVSGPANHRLYKVTISKNS